MPSTARIPRHLTCLPFRGSAAVAGGHLSWTVLRGPAWRRLLPDVYVHRDGYCPDDHRMWCDAVGLRLPLGAAIAGLSAAYLWGADLLDRDAPVAVVLPRAARMRPHSRVHVTRSALPDADRALLHRRVVKLPALRAYADERGGWPGISLLREVLALAEPLGESPMETRLRLLLLDAGLGPLNAQHDVLDARGRFVGRVDLAWPALRVAVEYDGDHHRERAHFRQDVARLNALRAAGWLVLRFTADDVLRHPRATISLVARALRERGTTPVPR
ncbi:endonuclease domain-containing protein [Micromonospora sp. NPDC048930]|uniref:endonuclease domain-containing protein n=1 Tax=Micromonospora sp. NPDC048930 TaxID=3364261 RepID=UPI00371BE010